VSIIPLGVKSKTSLTQASILASSTTPVPCVFTIMEVGFTTPIAYDTWMVALSHAPDATRFFATYRAAYAAERSTLVVTAQHVGRNDFFYHLFYYISMDSLL